MPDLIRYTGSGDWSALYIDGRLDTVGGHYLIDQRISELAGVTVVNDDAFMGGGNVPASTIAEIDAFIAKRRNDREEARRKRTLAEALIAEANRLDPIGGGR